MTATLKTGKKIREKIPLKKYESDYFFDKTNDILVVRWMNTEVTIATNYDAVEPMFSVQRYSREKKRKKVVFYSHKYSIPTTDAWAAAIYTAMGSLIIESVLEAKSGGELYGYSVWIALW